MTIRSLPVFQTGDVLSASNINRLSSAADRLYGWYYSINAGCESLVAESQAIGERWAGWVVLNGDTLKLRLFNSMGPTTVSVYFDGELVGTIHNATAGVKTFALDTAGQGWYQWDVYRVSIIVYDPIQTGDIWADQVYVTNSTLPTPSFPTFVSGATSAASDFNLLSDAIRAIEPTFTQPVVGTHGDVPDYLPTIRVQHRLNGVYVRANLWGPSHSLAVLYNGVVLKSWSQNSNGLRRIDETVPIIGSLSIGTFYSITFAATGDGRVKIWQAYEEQTSAASGYYENPRFEHGDYASADDLTHLTDNLSALATLGHWVSWAQREPIRIITTEITEPWNWQTFHVRRWRWLAFKAMSPYEGNEELPEPEIHWTYDGVLFNAYTLPELPNDEGGWFDMDTCPLKPGMMFYVSGCVYAIQTPYNGYEL